MVRRVLIVMVVFVWSAGVALGGTPVIVYVSDPLVDGSTLVINGSGFGTKAVAAPLKYDDFEQGFEGQELEGWRIIGDGAGQIPHYSNEARQAGSALAARCAFGDGQSLSAFGLNEPADLSTIYLDFWVYISETARASSNFKLYMLNTGPLTGLPKQSLRFKCGAFGEEAAFVAEGVNSDGAGRSSAKTAWPTGAANNRWSHLQVFLRQSDAGVGNGLLKVWLDGENLLERTDYFSRGIENSDDWRNVWLGFYRSPMISPACDASGDATVFFDNVYVDTTQARVELGNSPDYESCSHREVQVPTAWSDTEVVVTVNAGSFRDQDEVWVFITDESGVVAGMAGRFLVGVPGPGAPGQPVHD